MWRPTGVCGSVVKLLETRIPFLHVSLHRLSLVRVEVEEALWGTENYTSSGESEKINNKYVTVGKEQEPEVEVEGGSLWMLKGSVAERAGVFWGNQEAGARDPEGKVRSDVWEQSIFWGDLQQLPEQLTSSSCLLSSLSEKFGCAVVVVVGGVHWSCRFAELPLEMPMLSGKRSFCAPFPQLPSPFCHGLYTFFFLLFPPTFLKRQFKAYQDGAGLIRF